MPTPDRFIQHPDIATALATGYHKLYKPILCDSCGGVIQPNEHYGECDAWKTCSDCVDTEWKELTASEKFVALGYNSKFNG